MDAEWVAVLLTLTGFLGSLINALWARRERKAAAESAADAHQVHESMAGSQAAIAAALSRPAVAFVVEPFGTKWMLKNVGQDTATSVQIEWPNFTHPQSDASNVLEPGSGIAFGIGSRRAGARRPQSLRLVCDQRPDGVTIALPGVPDGGLGWG